MSEVLTKFQILKSYRLGGHPEKIRDTWSNLGGAVITEGSRTFVKDMVYFIQAPVGSFTTSGDWFPAPPVIPTRDDPFWPITQNGYPYNVPHPPETVDGPWDGSGGGTSSIGDYTYIEGPPLYGALVLCEASLYNSNPLTWSTATLEDDEEGYVSFVSGIISPHFRLLLTAEDLAASWNTPPTPGNTNPAYIAPDPTFVPYSETQTATIIIPDDELEKILVEVGVPFVLLEELELPRNKICDDIISTAMQEYFKFFPIIHRESVYNTIAQAGQIFRVPLPQGAYGAVRVFVNQGTTGEGGAAAGNPMHFFASEIAWWGGGSNNNWSPIRYGSGRSPGYSNLQGFGTLALDRAARQGILNYATRCEFHINYDEERRVKELVGYANRTGTLEIYWAHASNDWHAIDYARVPEVRKLATARVLRALGMLRGQVKADIPGSLNFDMFINRADKLEEEVMNFWISIVRPVAVRGSM